jgi:4'-phosphopantetheinyl transferase
MAESAGFPLPQPGQLDIWLWEERAGLSTSQLNDKERAHYERLIPPAARSQYLAAHTGLQRILAGYLGARPGEIDWQVGPRGKPWCPGTALKFNLSHSSDWTLLAVSGDEVGIDIERVRPVASQEALARRYFSPREQQLVATLAEGKARELFFRLWARKEACLKLVGTGLQGGLAELEALEVAPQGSVIEFQHIPEWPEGRCWLTDLEVVENYAAAVACAAAPTKLACYRLAD